VPVFAQDNGLITLDDATPAIDVVVALPPDATGALRLTLVDAAVTLTDEMNNTVFYATDDRLHGLELNIAPNSGSHTLTVQRLPYAATASVGIEAVDNIAVNGMAVQTTEEAITLGQSVNLGFTPTQPGDTVPVSITGETQGVVTAVFPEMNATTQVVDADGIVVMASYNGHVDGFNAVLDSGDYELTILTNGTETEQMAVVRAVPVEETTFLVAQASTETVSNEEVVQSAGCEAQVVVNSVNFRSGPGMGYSIIDYGFYNEQYPVGGRNSTNDWVVISTGENSSAWVAASTLSFGGSCNGLAVHDVPYRAAPVAPVIVATAQPVAPVIVQPSEPEIIYQYVDEPASNNNSSSSSSSNNSSGSNNNTSYDDDDHGGDDDDHGGDDDDDGGDRGGDDDDD
jgi:uncharacterized protein YraI